MNAAPGGIAPAACSAAVTQGLGNPVLWLLLAASQEWLPEFLLDRAVLRSACTEQRCLKWRYLPKSCKAHWKLEYADSFKLTTCFPVQPLLQRDLCSNKLGLHLKHK